MKAGFGRAVITPAVPVALAGFSARAEPALEVHDDLEARAVFLSDGERAACLIVLDLLALSHEFADPIRAAVGAALGLERAAVLTACTHTHNGPSALAGGEMLGWASPDGYGDLLVQRCVAAASAARAEAEECALYATTAPLPDGLSLNRRDLPYEPTIAVLDVRRPDGIRLGTIANVAIHPVAFGSPWLRVSTDWIGPFRSALERDAGGTAVLLSGALGDVNPIEHHHDVPTHLAEAEDEVRTLGRGVATAVRAAIESAEPAGDGIAVSSRVVDVRPGGTTLTDLLRIETLAVELVEWTLGDVAVVSVPGEAFHALGRAIVSARERVTLVAGLAPVWTGYLPMPYRDGYEESVSLGAEAVARIARELVTGASVGAES